VGNPIGQMSKLITIATLILLSCSTKDKYDLFKIDTADNFEFLDFEKISDIKTFNSKFWRADSIDDEFYFIAQYDFQKGDFKADSDKGLRIEGLAFRCLELDCYKNYGQRLYLTDNYQILNEDMELVNDKQIKELVKANILNYGKDPSLSDKPKEAVTLLYLRPEHRLDKLGHLFKIIIDGYIELIEAKKIETKFTAEKLAIEFPFRLHLRGNVISKDIPNLIEVPDDEQINGELLLDSVALNLK